MVPPLIALLLAETRQRTPLTKPIPAITPPPASSHPCHHACCSQPNHKAQQKANRYQAITVYAHAAESCPFIEFRFSSIRFINAFC